MQRNASRRIFSFAILLGSVTVLSACDPGIEYSPKDWSKTDHRKFERTIGLIDITVAPIGGLIGNRYLLPEITINNRGDVPVILNRAVLKANGSEYLAVPFGEKGWVTVPPTQMRRITVEWELGKPLYEVLKDPVEVDLLIKVGDKSVDVVIPMIKTFG